MRPNERRVAAAAAAAVCQDVVVVVVLPFVFISRAARFLHDSPEVALACETKSRRASRDDAGRRGRIGEKRRRGTARRRSEAKWERRVSRV
ncbi:hypothetical protein HPB47_000025 [Ixodes persulcatus]|uniref:Uncharacterized protein n=1 Tax=Ixodes persulcatus TaxID=34615 RepID=A0AC60PSW5_IXOPE|nr:hypothetical protein HPB47_000025 [Ixodes persulcatus]